MVFGNGPSLSPRDRSIVTVAALIARMQTIEMPYHFALAMNNGVKPSELSARTYRELKDGRNGQPRGEERDANKNARNQ